MRLLLFLVISSLYVTSQAQIDITELLKNKAAVCGLDTQDQLSIKIRCGASISSVKPLYILDGQIIDSLEDIVPDAIESINVLKGNAATALYGALGENGVIVINTKEDEVMYIIDGVVSDKEVFSDLEPLSIQEVEIIEGAKVEGLFCTLPKAMIIVVSTNLQLEET